MARWIERWLHDITPIAKLPLPEDLEDLSCMVRPRLRIPRRVIRQLLPRPAPSGCCTYHDQDWSAASEHAIRLLQIAQGETLTGQDAADRLAELAAAERLAVLDIDAINCLVSTYDPIMLDDVSCWFLDWPRLRRTGDHVHREDLRHLVEQFVTGSAA